MSLLNSGKSSVAQLIAGTGTPFNDINTRLVVGNSSVPVVDTQTSLVGTSVSKPLDAAFPQVTGNVLRYRSTFTTTEANFHWNEWGLSNGIVLLNRVVDDLGIKTSNQSWQFTVTMTVTTV